MTKNVKRRHQAKDPLGWNQGKATRQTTLAMIERARVEQLPELELDGDDVPGLPARLFELTNLTRLKLGSYSGGFDIVTLPPEIGDLVNLTELSIYFCPIESLPPEIGKLTKLKTLKVYEGKLASLPPEIGNLSQMEWLSLNQNELGALPPEIGKLTKLHTLHLYRNHLSSLPSEIKHLDQLNHIGLQTNEFSSIPRELTELKSLAYVVFDNNPLNPADLSAYEQGLPALMAYLKSLDRTSEPLYEAKLLVVGEGDVGKTTLLKALTGEEPRRDEKSTHGVSIDINSMYLAHPEKEDVTLQFNAWDFGGQEVYRVTHQFFFSSRSIYLLVWEPRMGVQQCQVEDWLKLIRLRVGDGARVVIVSTHAKTGERLARIDKPVFLRDYGSMIVDFVEVDSLEYDAGSQDKFGIVQLKSVIAAAAKDLEQMGMPFNVQWRAARDELVHLGQSQPRVTFEQFRSVCERHNLSAIDTETMAGLIHDLGYIVYYGNDERLKSDVVLQPEWLTKAIAFVLEDRATQERDGVLPDSCLEDVWLNHRFKNEPRYESTLYPFFLRLMEKYDVSYRLNDGRGSLVAQHVPQVRPALPWLPDEEPKAGMRRLAMVYVMDEAPPGLIPWMIVRTHEYAFEQAGHRMHWQNGMFLRNKNRQHGEAMLELRGREFHLFTEAVWPEYFMTILLQTLTKLVRDNWPGMEGRYSFNVPCPTVVNGKSCEGRFEISALRQFLEEGDVTYRCQKCHTRHKIVDLLFGFEDEEPREQLARIEGKLEMGFEAVKKEIAGLESRLANYVMAIMRGMANEAKDGPRLFDIKPVSGNWRRI